MRGGPLRTEAPSSAGLPPRHEAPPALAPGPALVQTCPVCGYGGAPQEAGRCPQCDADLQCFRALEALREGPAATAGTRALPLWAGLAAGGLLLVLALAAVLLSRRIERLESRLAAQEARARHLSAAAGTTRAAAAPAGVEEPASPSPAPLAREGGSASFRVCTATPSDTLWAIARRVYGAGALYPALLEHNPGLGIYDLEGGERIRVLSDVAAAREICRLATRREGGRTLWEYTAREGDSLAGVAAKFYEGEGREARLLRDNPSLDLRPGARVVVALEP